MTQTQNVRQDFDAEAFLDLAYTKYRENRGARQREKHMGRQRGHAHIVYLAAEGQWAAVLHALTGLNALGGDGDGWADDPRAVTDFEKAQVQA